tara:strand:+ start:1154 stop:2197 length:1044 start_codon:yes stop_codon:yes gene_type:complete
VKDKIDYKSAGVDIDAGNKSVELIKKHVQSTFTNNVLTGIGSFGSLYDLKEVANNYDHPVMVQSIDGVGTKMIVARMMNNFNSIGIDLLSAAANDILVMGAKPITLLDYIATEKLKPEFIEQIVSGMSKACQETGVSLVGGEIAEMPDTYLKGEYDLVGIITGIVEKSKIISGEKIKSGDRVLALPSSGLHTNGYSLARKLIFEIEKLSIDDIPKGMDQSVGEILIEPHTNYTNQIQYILDNDIFPSGIAHITGGGLLENIPRILPKNLNVFINKGSWPILPVFDLLQTIGNIAEQEMYRVFNMGVGMVLIVDEIQAKKVANLLMNRTKVYEIGYIMDGENKVLFNE